MQDEKLDLEERKRLLEEEDRKLRRLRIETDFLLAVIYQDGQLDVHSARRLIEGFRQRVLTDFPGKDFTFDLILLPRFDRALRERWGEGFDRLVH